MTLRTGRFGRADRLLRSSEFKQVARCGKRAVARYFVMLAAPGVLGGSERQRLGVTVSRRVGNAVVRNRVKRQIREWFRHARMEMRPGLEIVVIARREAAELSAQETMAALENLMESLEAGVR